MSTQPVQVPTALLIFKDLAFRGFWLSGRWSKQAGPQARAALMDRLAAHVQRGELRAPPVAEFGLGEWREALAEDRRAHKAGKVLLVPGKGT
jgi:trans-2-enoyl-CoA reductase